MMTDGYEVVVEEEAHKTRDGKEAMVVYNYREENTRTCKGVVRVVEKESGETLIEITAFIEPCENSYDVLKNATKGARW